MEGYIKLYRKFAYNEHLHGDGVAQSLFIQLLLGCNFHGAVGEGFTSVVTLASKIGVTRQTVSKKLRYLKKCGMIELKINRRGTQYKIINFDTYQSGQLLNSLLSAKLTSDSSQINISCTPNEHQLLKSLPHHKKKKRNKNAATFSDDDFAFAKKWSEKFYKGPKKPDLDKWANHVRLARKDGYDLEAIFDFVAASSFWPKNAQSFPAMRKRTNDLCKLDTIKGQMGPTTKELREEMEANRKRSAEINAAIDKERESKPKPEDWLF